MSVTRTTSIKVTPDYWIDEEIQYADIAIWKPSTLDLVLDTMQACVLDKTLPQYMNDFLNGYDREKLFDELDNLVTKGRGYYDVTLDVGPGVKFLIGIRLWECKPADTKTLWMYELTYAEVTAEVIDE